MLAVSQKNQTKSRKTKEGPLDPKKSNKVGTEVAVSQCRVMETTGEYSRYRAGRSFLLKDAQLSLAAMRGL